MGQGPEYIDTADGTVHTTVSINLGSAVIPHIGMLHEFADTEAVYLQLLHIARVGNLHPCKGIGRKILYLQKLVGRGITTKALPVLKDTACKIGTYARDTAEQGTVGKVEVYGFIAGKFLRINISDSWRSRGIGREYGTGRQGIHSGRRTVRGGQTLVRLRQDRHQLVLGRNAYERGKALPLLVGKTVDTAEIVLRAETPTLGTITIDAPDLERSQAKAKQLGAVCLVGIEQERVWFHLGHGIITGRWRRNRVRGDGDKCLSYPTTPATATSGKQGCPQYHKTDIEDGQQE